MQSIEALERFDGLQSPFEPNIPLPQYGGIQHLMSASAALQFLQGERERPLRRLCRHASTWRRLGNRSNDLIARTIGVAFYRQSAQLIAEFLAEMPSDEALPNICTEAFSPPMAEDVDLCAAAQGEWRLSNANIAWVENPGRRSFLERYWIDPEATSHHRAMQFAPYCAADRAIELLHDRTASVDMPVATCSWLDFAHNGAGCLLDELAFEGFSRYEYRLLDGCVALVEEPVLIAGERQDSAEANACRISQR